MLTVRICILGHIGGMNRNCRNVDENDENEKWSCLGKLQDVETKEVATVEFRRASEDEEVIQV